uniref:Uncharacterized protein n=1 Tax=Ditylenchus dipsaci TaxID=166011 RepID=A0A915CTL0_9BILA
MWAKGGDVWMNASPLSLDYYCTTVKGGGPFVDLSGKPVEVRERVTSPRHWFPMVVVDLGHQASDGWGGEWISGWLTTCKAKGQICVFQAVLHPPQKPGPIGSTLCLALDTQKLLEGLIRKQQQACRVGGYLLVSGFLLFSKNLFVSVARMIDLIEGRPATAAKA